METDKTFDDVVATYKNTTFNNKCPLCDLEGSTFERSGNYFIKGNKKDGKGITYRQIYKDIMKTNKLYIEVRNKKFFYVTLFKPLYTAMYIE